MRQLAPQSKHRRGKLYRIISHWLEKVPPRDNGRLEQHRHLIFDGTFLHRPTSIVALMDASRNQIISGKYGVSESSARQLLIFFQSLVAKGLDPESCTVDGNPHVIRAMRTLWPAIKIQRCLVHIQRQGLMWCRRYPKMASTRRLRDMFLEVTQIGSKGERDEFLESIIRWEQEYGRHIDLRPEKGKVFSDIKRARRMLLKALPNMFYYRDDPNIPPTTNGMESYFSRLKGHYREHRGLPKKKLDHYFDWYFFYKPT